MAQLTQLLMLLMFTAVSACTEAKKKNMCVSCYIFKKIRVCWSVMYHNDPKFLDIYEWANSADPDPRGAV